MATRYKLPGITDRSPPGPNAGRWERFLWAVIHSPQAQLVGAVTPATVGGGRLKDLLSRIDEANPGLVKWAMDRSGRVKFGPPSVYHSEIVDDANRLAAGTIDQGRVHVLRDLTPARLWRTVQERLDSIREAVARDWVERGRMLAGVAGVGTAAQAAHPSMPQPVIPQLAPSPSPTAPAITGVPPAVFPTAVPPTAPLPMTPGAQPTVSPPAVRPYVPTSSVAASEAAIRQAAEILGLDAAGVRRKIAFLERIGVFRLLSSNTIQDQQELDAWWGRLSDADKLTMVLFMPGQPMLRDMLDVRRMVSQHPRFQEFIDRPENAQVWQAYMMGGTRMALSVATPAQKEFLAWVEEEARRLMTTTAGYQQLNEQGRSRVTSVLSQAPYLMIPWTSPVTMLAGKHILGPVVRGVWQGGVAVAKKVSTSLGGWIGRLAMREGEGYVDQMVQQLLDVAEKNKSWLQASLGDKYPEWLKKYTDSAMQFRKEWSDFYTGRMGSQQRADAEAAGWLNGLRSSLGLGDQHYLVVATLRGLRDKAWQQWQDEKASIWKSIDELRAQRSLATTPDALKAIDNAINEQIQTLTQSFARAVQATRAITPQQAAEVKGIRLSPQDVTKVKQLDAAIQKRMDSIWPPGSPEYRPHYFPTAPNKSMRDKLLEPPSSVDPYKHYRYLSATPETARDAIIALHRRVANVRFLEDEAPRAAAYQKFLKETLASLDPVLQDTLRQAFDKIGARPVEAHILGSVGRALTDTVVTAVTVGRFIPFMTTNILGNVNNLVVKTLQRWSRGEYTNPLDAFRHIPVPLHVTGAMSEAATVGTMTGFARIRQMLFSQNSIVEGWFRSAAYRMEVAAQMRAHMARGVTIDTTVLREIEKKGWQYANEVFYNYADRFIMSFIGRDLSYFLQYRISNLMFWYDKLTSMPWLWPTLLRMAEERPEVAVKVNAIADFLDKSLGIESRKIDVMAKSNTLDALQFIVAQEPRWMRDRKERLGIELAAAMSKYKDNPNGLEAYLQARPDLAAYKRYVEQGLWARMMLVAYKAVQPGAVVEWAMTALGVQTSYMAVDRQKRGPIPQIALIRDAIGLFGKKYGITGLETLLEPPSDAAVKREVQRLLLEEARNTGRPVRDTAAMDSATYSKLYEQAAQNVMVRRFLDRGADLLSPLGAGDFVVRFEQDIWDELAKNSEFREAVAQVRFPPPPAVTHRYATQYGLDPDAAVFMARREFLRGPDVTTVGERRTRAASFEALPEDVKNLLRVAHPTERAIVQRIQSALTTYRSFVDDGERSTWIKSSDPEARLLRAYFESRYTDRQRRVFDQVRDLSVRDKEKWYRTARLENVEDASIFEDLYPSLTEQFRARDVGTPPGVQAPPIAEDRGPWLPRVTPRAAEPSQLPAGLGADAAKILDPAVPGGYPGNRMSLSSEGERYILNKEGLRLHAYRDPGGVWTIGYGQTGLRVERLIAAQRLKGHSDDDIERLRLVQITPDQASAWAKERLASDQAAVRKALGNTRVTRDQFDAFVSFSYNAGQGAMEKAVKLFQSGDMEGLRDFFNTKTRDQKGVVQPGLVTRRNEEFARITGTPSTTAMPARSVAPSPPVAPGTAPAREATKPSAAPDIRTLTPNEREDYRTITSDGRVIYHGNWGGVLLDYIRSVNPQLDPRAAKAIKDAILTAYEDPQRAVRLHSFDPLWIAGIMATRSGFNPGYNVGGRWGLGGLTPTDAPGMDPKDLLDPVKNTRALIERFISLQARLGTRGAIESLGLDFTQTYLAANRVSGLRPTTISSPQEQQQAKLPVVIEHPDTPEEKSFARFYSRLIMAGGDPESEEYTARRRAEWKELMKSSDPRTLENLKLINPELYYHAVLARDDTPTWWRGRVFIEARRDDMPKGYLEWKVRILSAESVEAAAEVYASGSLAQRQWFRRANGDMDRFFQDRAAGVQRDYYKYTFTDVQDVKFLDARARLARVLSSGDAALIRSTVRDIRSIYGDDTPGFLRALKAVAPDDFKTVAPYLTVAPYGPDEQQRVLRFKVMIDDLLIKAKGDPKFFEQAAAIFRDPEHAGTLALAQEHESAWYEKVRRVIVEQKPEVGRFVHPTEFLQFERWRNSVEEAARMKDQEALVVAWNAGSESFRQEYMTRHSEKYVNIEAALNGVPPAEWVALKQKRMYGPSLDFLRSNDVYGSWSAEKLGIIARDDPGALAWILSDPDNLESLRSAFQQRVAALWMAVLRKHDYNPTLLKAIPDDGTRGLLVRMDPVADEMFRRFNIPVSPLQYVKPRTVEDLWGKGTTVEEEIVDGKKTGRFVVRPPRRDGTPFADSPGSLILDAEHLLGMMGVMNRLPTLPPQVEKFKKDMLMAQGFVQALRFAYQGYAISQQGGGFLEQLPMYFQAAQAMAATGIFGAGAMSFFGGPWGLVIGGVLGILGSIFGAKRQREEEARRRREAEEREREQRGVEREQIRERLQQMSQAEFADLERSTGALRAFVERPTAITRQALIDALRVPRPSW